MTEYQALQDEIALALHDHNCHELCDASSTMLDVFREQADAVMPTVKRELAARDAVIQQIKALAKRWAAWVPDGTAPHPMYSAGQSATATGCAEELVAILSALPSTEQGKLDD